MNLFNRKSLLILFIGLWSANLTIAEDIILSKFEQDQISIHAERISLMNILLEIQNKCSVKIHGLENRKDDPVTYISKKDHLESVIKNFLSHLGEQNYAFEFSNGQLRRVFVMPKSKIEELPLDIQTNQNEAVNVVKVIEVVARSQAQSSGLLKDDIILEYNGQVIHNVEQLIKETQKKTSTDQVELLVLRENYRLRFIMTGGFIGVRIRDVSIAKKNLSVF